MELKRWLKMFELSGGKVGSVQIDERQLKWSKFTWGGTKNKEGQDDDSKVDIGINRGWSAEGIQRFNNLNLMVARDRCEHKDFFPTW